MGLLLLDKMERLSGVAVLDTPPFPPSASCSSSAKVWGARRDSRVAVLNAGGMEGGVSNRGELPPLGELHSSDLSAS